MQLLSRAKIAPVNDAAAAEDVAQRVLDVAPPVVRVIRALMRHHRLQGLSVPQFRAMALLSWSPHASLSGVADFIGSSPPAASRMIDGLVARKLVARHQCPNDRRQVSLALTPRGQSAYRASREATRQKLAERLTPLTRPQQKLVCEAMDLLADLFGSDADGIGLSAIKQAAEKPRAVRGRNAAEVASA